METNTMKAYACPTCGAQLECDGASYRCQQHGQWFSYSANLLVHAPSDDYKTREHFTMPWEGTSRTA